MWPHERERERAREGGRERERERERERAVGGALPSQDPEFDKASQELPHMPQAQHGGGKKTISVPVHRGTKPFSVQLDQQQHLTKRSSTPEGHVLVFIRQVFIRWKHPAGALRPGCHAFAHRIHHPSRPRTGCARRPALEGTAPRPDRPDPAESADRPDGQFGHRPRQLPIYTGMRVVFMCWLVRKRRWTEFTSTVWMATGIGSPDRREPPS